MSKDYIRKLESMKGERRIVDKHKFYFGKGRTWSEAHATIPLCPETTPKRYDVISEGLAHAREVESRMKTGKARRFIDTHTDDLRAGLDRAMKWLDGGDAGKGDGKWKTEKAEPNSGAARERKEPSGGSDAAKTAEK